MERSYCAKVAGATSIERSRGDARRRRMSDTLHPYDANRPENRPSRVLRAEPAKARVLILDDDRDSRLVCRAYCDLFDHPSQSVASLDEALGALRRLRFDVVVI